MTWPYPAPEDDGGARHLVSGLALPDVALASTDGAIVKLCGCAGACDHLRLSLDRAARPPQSARWDDIPGAHGSTPEAEGFRDLYSKFAAQGAKVFGVSTQDSGHQREFALRMKLPFPLLSDAHLAFADALMLPRFETGGETYLKRLTLVVRDGRIDHVFYPVHPPDLHAMEVLGWLRGQTRRDGGQTSGSRPVMPAGV